MVRASKRFLEKDTNIKKLKIPVNISEIFDYKEMFTYVLSRGFVPEPYLSSSKYSIRAGQDNKQNFIKYMEKFLVYKRMLKILPGFVHLVYNTRYGGVEVVRDIDLTIRDLLSMGYKREELNLILSYPRLVNHYASKSYNVTVSSASILTYKKIIDILLGDFEALPSNVSYVLPSTYQFALRKLPSNSFEILVNNGCKLGCINAGVITDHKKFCPIKKKDLDWLYYDEFQEETDLIHRWKFKSLVAQGWRSFKVSGRQAPLQKIMDTIIYYLDPSESKIPYIDNPVFFGTSSNG